MSEREKELAKQVRDIIHRKYTVYGEEKQIVKLILSRESRLVDGLRFYGLEENYDYHDHIISRDEGEKARSILKELGYGKEDGNG